MRQSVFCECIKPIFLSLFLSLYFFSYSQPGSLDLSFGNNGEVVTSFGNQGDVGRKVALTPDGGIIMAGEVFATGAFSRDVGLVKYNETGKIDSSFGVNGEATANTFSNNPTLGGLAVQPDGKIVIAYADQFNSYYNSRVARFLPNGVLDSSFGTDGITSFDAETSGFSKAMALQPDGKIVVTGTVDNSDLSSLVIWRYQTNGSYDSSFGTDGKATVFFNINKGPMSLVLQPDNKFVIATTAYSSMCVIRLNTDASLDGTFRDSRHINSGYVLINVNESGYRTTGSSLVLQSDNKIVVGGSVSHGPVANLGLARLDTTGALDETFGNAGIQFTTLPFYSYGYTIARQADEKILLGGYTLSNQTQTDFVIARYTKEGILDSSFGTNGYTITDFNFSNDDYAYSMVLQQNGKILLGGLTKNIPSQYEFALARYNNDSSAVLPISVLSFSGRQQQDHIQISWQASNGISGTTFILTKSTDGVHFSPVYETKENGNGGSAEPYSYADRNPYKGTNYYRIEQKHTDGTASFSEIIKVPFNSPLLIRLMPNPVVNTLYITGLIPDVASNLLIADNSGKIIKAVPHITSGSLSIDVSMLPSGIYYLKAGQPKQYAVIKFVKERKD